MEHHHHSDADQHSGVHLHSGADADSADVLAELLELDAEVLHDYLSAAIAWVRGQAADLPRYRIVDLGSGVGSAAVALAQQFGSAEVLAVDASAEMLARVQAKAIDLGLDGRIGTLRADLDGPWPDTGPADVVWASMSLHHLADPDRALTEVFTSIRPGGLMAIAEMNSLPRFLPDDIGLGRPGLEARCRAAAAELNAHRLPHLGADWGPRLAKAGFTAVAERAFSIDLDPPLPAATGRYAWLLLQRTREQLAGTLGAEDLATLDTLTDTDGPGSVLHRQDLAVRGTRTIWAGRRP
jgi:SAM-dependent methyltransferase